MMKIMMSTMIALLLSNPALAKTSGQEWRCFLQTEDGSEEYTQTVFDSALSLIAGDDILFDQSGALCLNNNCNERLLNPFHGKLFGLTLSTEGVHIMVYEVVDSIEMNFEAIAIAQTSENGPLNLFLPEEKVVFSCNLRSH